MHTLIGSKTSQKLGPFRSLPLQSADRHLVKGWVSGTTGRIFAGDSTVLFADDVSVLLRCTQLKL